MHCAQFGCGVCPSNYVNILPQRRYNDAPGRRDKREGIIFVTVDTKLEETGNPRICQLVKERKGLWCF